MFKNRPLAASALAMLLTASAMLHVPAQAAPGAAVPPPPVQAGAPGAAPAAPSVRIMSPDDPDNKLHLTADQQKKMIVIDANFRAKLAALQADTKTPAAQKQTIFKGYADDYEKQSVAILTPDQRTQRDQMKAQYVKYMSAAQAKAKDWQALNAKLRASLSPSQLTTMRANAADAQKQLQAIAQDPKMSMADKQAKGKVLTANYLNKMVGVLNPQQKTLFKQLQQMRDEIVALQRLASNYGN